MQRHSFFGILISTLFIVLTGCSSTEERPVHSYAEGSFIISTQTDSTRDFSGFEILVAGNIDGDVDTLGIAETDVEGSFSMNIDADAEGIYPLIVSRAGSRMAVDELIVVNKDSTRITGRFPLGARKLRIISQENAAWTAYKNAKSFHNKELVRLLKAKGYFESDIKRIVMQTSTILWSLRNSYPGTIGANLATAESVTMLAEWNDSLAVERAEEVSVDNPNIVKVVRSARKSIARLAGQDSSVSYIKSFVTRVEDPDLQAELEAELVIAHTDSLERDEALSTALDLRRKHPESKWAEWAATAAYELENLMPEMSAPAFSTITRDGVQVSQDSFNGKFFILEFYDPKSEAFRRESEARSQLYAALDDRLFGTLSVSVEPDSVINEAIFDESTLEGSFVFPPGGYQSELARAYNIHVVPTRYLIGVDGRIISKYVGPALGSLEQDLVAIISGLNARTTANN
jgi:hypothetical protein